MQEETDRNAPNLHMRVIIGGIHFLLKTMLLSVTAKITVDLSIGTLTLHNNWKSLSWCISLFHTIIISITIALRGPKNISILGCLC